MANQTLKKLELVIADDQIKPALLEALNILQNVLHHKQVWETHFGAHNRARLKAWENRGHRFLASLKIVDINPTDDGQNNTLPVQPGQ